MNREEYARMYAHEEHLWWYVGMRAMAMAWLDDAGLAGRPLEILDGGCGTGAGVRWLEAYGRTTGLDLSEEALAFCRERQLDRLVRASVEYLPFADGSFDLVTSFDVLYHRWVADDVLALREFHRVLRPGGQLLLRVPALPRLAGRHDVAVHTRRRYHKRELVDNLKSAGFLVERVSYANFLLLPLVMAKRLAERWQTSAPSDLEATPGWLNAALRQVLRWETALLRLRSLPLGVSLLALARRGSQVGTGHRAVPGTVVASPARLP